MQIWAGDQTSAGQWSIEIDACDIRPAIRVPTLITQRTGDCWFEAQNVRYWQAALPARHVELEAGRRLRRLKHERLHGPGIFTGELPAAAVLPNPEEFLRHPAPAGSRQRCSDIVSHCT